MGQRLREDYIYAGGEADDQYVSVVRQTNIPGLVGASFINPSSLGNNSKAAFLRACAALNERFVKMVSTTHPLSS